jgi:GntR family transcriptional regulator/MocR family aminotransferase
VVAAALGRGLALEGLGSYLEGEAGDPALVLGYATPPEHAFTAALSRLAAVLTSGRPSGPTARGRTTRHRIP